MLSLAEMFLKGEELSVTGYKRYGKNRYGGKWDSGNVEVLVHKSPESRVQKSRGAGVS